MIIETQHFSMQVHTCERSLFQRLLVPVSLVQFQAGGTARPADAADELLRGAAEGLQLAGPDANLCGAPNGPRRGPR